MITGLGQQAGAVDGAPARDWQRKTVSLGALCSSWGRLFPKGSEVHLYWNVGDTGIGPPAHPWDLGHPVVTRAPWSFCSGADRGKGCVCVRVRACVCVCVRVCVGGV